MRSPNDLGFTGSQHGMSYEAKEKLIVRIRNWQLESPRIYLSSPTVFRHGDCIGADAIAAEIASHFGYLVHAHPQFNESKRAFSPYNDVIHAPKHPLERNHDIVDLSHTMIATPHTKNEVIRSGTWATIRYARQLNRELCIIFPDGTETWENSGRADGREAARA